MNELDLFAASIYIAESIGSSRVKEPVFEIRSGEVGTFTVAIRS